MPNMSAAQFETVYAMLSLTIASLGASALFFFMARQYVAKAYQVSVLISGIVVSIATYHYVRIFNSWNDAFTLSGGGYLASGTPFNDAYRYADWLLTVPLLMVEFVAVLGLARSQSRPLITKLVIAAVLMIVTGYPGEISDDPMTKHVWGWVSTVPFIYILYTLWVRLGQAIETQSERVKGLVQGARLLLLGTWGVYPLAYLASALGIGGGASAEVVLQVGYSLADITAKAGFGLFVFAIAKAKTEEDAAAA